MPLIKKSSKKAFEHNIKAEMDAGKPQKQSLAIAFDVQRRNRKKMASGGQVRRDPMPSVDSRDDMELQMSHPLEMHKGYKQDKPTPKGRDLRPGDDMMDHDASADDNNMTFAKRPMMESHGGYVQDKPTPHERALRPGDDMSDHDAGASDNNMTFSKKPKMENHGLYKQHMSNVDEDEMSFQKRPSIPSHHEAQAGDDNMDGDMDMSERIMRKRMARGGMVDADSIDLQAEDAEHSNQYYPINEHEVVGKKIGTDLNSIHQPEDSNESGMSDDYHSPSGMDEDDGLPMNVYDHIDSIMNRMKKRR